jgi:flagellar hook-associated protein FlgK
VQRAAVSGVSLNAEAAKLLQFQQSYQAVARLVSTLNTITQATLSMLP